MFAVLKRFTKDECGATVIEYGLIASIISIGIIGALNALSPELNATFDDATNGLAGR